MESLKNNNINPIERMFALRLCDVYGGQDNDLLDKVKRDWEDNPVQTFVQGNVEGTVTSESFVFRVGSWVGQQILANVSTQDGFKEVYLCLQEEEMGLPAYNGEEPQPLFSIRPPKLPKGRLNS